MSLPQTTREYQLSKVGSYNNLVVGEKPVNPPGPHQVLVKVHAVSLNYRDLAITKGFYGAALPENLVPCSDMAGEIIALGEGVTEWEVGARVAANFALDHLDGDSTLATQKSSLGNQTHGVLTHYRAFPAHSLVRIPDFWSYEEASTLPCAAVTAYNALHGPNPVKAGDHVLILGTGGVAIWGLQFALASGATVIVTSSSDEKLKVASKLGAQHLINYKTNPDWDKKVMEITNNRGVDHVLEVGGPGTLARSLNAVRIAGYVHVIGFVSMTKDAGDLNIISQTIRKSLYLRGLQTGPVAQFRNMIRLIIANPEKTKPVVDKVFTFDEAISAFTHQESQQHVGKIVIKMA